MRTIPAVVALLCLAVSAPANAQTRLLAKTSAAGGVPSLGAELTAETNARVNADATEMANRTNADAQLQEQLTQLQAALAAQQGAQPSAIGSLEADGVKGPLPIYSFVLAASQSSAVGGGGTTGKVVFKDVTFTKVSDAATVVLFHDLATGAHLKSVLFTIPAKDPSGKAPPKPYRQVTLDDAIITNIETGGSNVLESYSVEYRKVTIEYFPATGAPTQFCFDLGRYTDC
jgi:type VI secretion system Hcp family effector